METKILFAGAIFLGGFLWSYAFVRQILFNLTTAYPLIRKMRSLREDLIAVGASRYTTVSMVTCSVLAAVILFVVLRFCKPYLIYTFLGAALLAAILLFPKVSMRNQPMFDAFCTTYYRFIPNDELRTAVYNKKIGQIKTRLKAMGIDGHFIPDFKEK